MAASRDFLKRVLDGIDVDELLSDYYGLTKSERVKYAIEISKILLDDVQQTGTVRVELIYPDEHPTDTSQTAA